MHVTPQTLINRWEEQLISKTLVFFEIISYHLLISVLLDAKILYIK